VTEVILSRLDLLSGPTLDPGQNALVSCVIAAFPILHQIVSKVANGTVA
jgi:hypothetical protein